MALSPTKHTRLRGIRLVLARGLLVALSLGLSLATLEVGLRLSGAKPRTATALGTYYAYDPQVGWRGKPDVTCRFATTEFDVVIEQGSDGFRRGCPDIPAGSGGEKPATVWVLGDSFTWGWGVEQGETYLDRLNQQSHGMYFRNLGQAGHSAVQEYLLLRDLLEKEERPAAVAVMFCLNDLAENLEYQRGKPSAKISEGKVEIVNVPVSPPLVFNPTVWLKNNSLACNHINYYLMRCQQKIKRSPATPPANVVAASGTPQKAENRVPSLDENWTQERTVVLKEIYRRMSDLCRERNIPFAVIGAKEHHAALDQICTELKVPFLEVSQPFALHSSGPNGDQPHTFRNDGHCTELGNRLFAQAIQPQIGKIVSLESAGSGETARQGNATHIQR